MPQLARWLTFIEEFDYEVVPRGGRRHTNGDGLRRRTGPLALSYTGAGWIKMALSIEVGLGPGYIVLDSDPAPLPIFGPFLLWPNG